MARHRRSPLRSLLNYLAMATIAGLGRLPLPAARWVARRLAHLAWFLVPRVKSVGLSNLDRAYGDELTPRKKKMILRESLENLALVAVEFPRVRQLRGDFMRRHIEVRGTDYLSSEHGTVLVGIHFGNWEWMAPVFAAYAGKAGVIVRPLDHAPLNAYIDGLRRAGGVQTISKDKAATEVLALLKEKNHIGIMIDQSPRDNGVPVTFFGQPCWATIAPVMFAIRARVPVHPTSMTRLPDGRYLLEVLPEIPMNRTGRMTDDLVTNTQRCQDAVEAIIRRNPGHWLWLHRRWAPRPRLEKEWNELCARKAKRDNAL